MLCLRMREHVSSFNTVALVTILSSNKYVLSNGSLETMQAILSLTQSIFDGPYNNDQTGLESQQLNALM